MKLALYCTCGATWKGDVSRKAVPEIQREWDATHYGKGHKACDARTAAKSRAKADKEP